MDTHRRTRMIDVFLTFAFFALFAPILCGLVVGAFFEHVAALWAKRPFSPQTMLLFAVTEPYRYAGAVAIISGLIAGMIVARRGRLPVLLGIIVPLAGYLIAGLVAAVLGIGTQREILGSGFEFTEPVLNGLGIIPRRFRSDDMYFIVLVLAGAIVLSLLYQVIVVGILKRTA